MSLNLFLDDCNPHNWEQWLSTGLFKGITTNPTLLKRASQPCEIQNLRYLAEKAEDLGCKNLHLQAWGNTSEEILKSGLALAKISATTMKIHIKVPITKEGMQAAKALIDSKISLTFTACYEVKQILIAASIGASYVAPYLGRINDSGKDGLSELITMNNVLKGVKSNCTILVASIRQVNEIVTLASNGFNTFTISPKLADEIINSHQTEEASKVFQIDVMKSILT